MPTHQFAVVALAWLRAAGLAAVAVGLGSAVDSGRPLPALIFAIVGVGVAVAAASWSEVLCSRAQAQEELDLRALTARSLFAAQGAARTDEAAKGAGALVADMTASVERVSHYRATFPGPTLAAATVPFGILLVLGASVSWSIAAVLAGLTLLVPLVIGGFFALFRASNATYRRTRSSLHGIYLESITGMSTLACHNATAARAATVRKVSGDLRRHVMHLLARNQTVLIVNDLVFGLTMIVAGVGMGLTAHYNGTLTIGKVLTLVILTTGLLEPIDAIGRIFYVGMAGAATWRHLKALINTEPHWSQPLPIPQNADLSVENVCAGYGDVDILHEVSLQIPPGAHVAITGTTGSGKTTLSRILQGTLTPSSGTVRINGAVATVEMLRAATAIMPQHPYFVTGSIADNLHLAAPQASEEDLWAALRQAHLADEVLAMGGLQASVGEAGMLLSGGQGARLALARALLRKSPILILDEPTAHLDTATEDLIAAALSQLQDKTVIAITHRRRLLAGVDLHIVLSAGHLVADGDVSTLGQGGQHVQGSALGGEVTGLAPEISGSLDQATGSLCPQSAFGPETREVNK